ncbi:ABC transporter ATP-binding protein [Marivita geojedonensis]|uniref:Branched-chain amino acid ABC transporter n=1 Tax=Marivita geojedonensis TaxID=1123756 RepID=A0A1X4NN22_9RHOB|nr:ABC transporter ATP-binding protein [Marivita geojedonensis]OSQ51952.1 branched-chain amino acid ABC transporter [Marivita geojedonensis]PRY81313.1 branched-chain amino acid transport system ATP-binding protein [Marivita geojedonensis]
MLEVRNLSVSYGKHRALDGASLRVGKGEIVVILGANGAGKSTLLKAICGICEGHVAGQVSLQNAELVGEKPHRIVEAGIALVPEGRGVFGDLTVEENLTLGAYAERARDEEAGNLQRVLSLFPKLQERRKQTVRTMSGGEQQMVAIGRAMMSNPSILALDEPSLGLSPLLCKDLFESLRVVKQAGLGILLVEQNAKQSLRIADRGYLLENGTIVHEDDAERLANDPAVQKAYLGGSGAATGAKRPAPVAAPKPASPRPASGPKPSDIAAAAMKSVSAPARPVPAAKPAAPAPRPAPVTNGTAPAPKPNAPNISDLVAKASATASRRNGAMPPPRAPVPAPAPTQPARPAQPAIPDFASSSDRLRAMIEDIEAAARRAESYKPRR